ncbi:Abc domain-containing protein [Mycena sanguinolenta]|uniref:Abc domain-containing protein n=1 Tax=Mycena sanguinolenta TaxID=230812 RepID=A0A8H6XSW2_9AGAR|nr:Abc domain-containing protein [Mycena sanguinolenta]
MTAVASKDASRGGESRSGEGRGGGGAAAGKEVDYTKTVLITREQREKERADRFANNATNAALYARAGYTTTHSSHDQSSPTFPASFFEDEYGNPRPDPHAYLEDDYEYDSDEYEDYSSVDSAEAEEDDEDDLAMALETTVKEMALTDWARGRVLDGCWVAPADVFYGLKGVGGAEESTVRSVHPVAWSISPPSSPSQGPTTSASSVTLSSSTSSLTSNPSSAPPSTGAPAAPQTHPAPPAPPPPTYALAEAAHNAHHRQLRVVLLPALQNVVRRVVLECALDAVEAASCATAGDLDGKKPLVLDPAMRAAKMTLAEVVAQLREEEGVWFNGMDWGAKRLNAREAEVEAQLLRDAQHETEREYERRREGGEGSDDSGLTPRTGTDTSPALSTSTLGTTPSPPPLERPKTERGAERGRGRDGAAVAIKTIPVAPVLNPPRLLRPIPYVPETIAHLPQYSLEALKTVWREACEPLYHCRCSVCERAMAVQQQGKIVLSPASPVREREREAPRDRDPQREKEREREREKEREREREKERAPPGDGPWVVHVPNEDDADAGVGADSVIQLVEAGDADYPQHERGRRHRDERERERPRDRRAPSPPQGLEGLTPAEMSWLKMEAEAQGGPGAWEREMGITDDDERMDDGDDYEEEEGDGDGMEDEYDERRGEFKLHPAPAAWGAGSAQTLRGGAGIWGSHLRRELA